MWAALWVDRRIKGLQAKEDRRQLRDALIASIDKNLDLLKKLEEKIRHDPLPIYAYDVLHDFLDITLFESTSLRKYELLEIKMCQSIDKIRYELMNLQSKLEVIQKNALELSASEHAKHFVENIYLSIRFQLPAIVETLNDTKKNLENIR